ncbi:WD40 repeat-like protein [Venturia nashicola]|uniref:WD40 repeat-like protein n=1 Tax=Venturia nashicola TaxID=86259 RepID=A0A4Z1P3Q6_9PEZI|nr:WD40 repeat-like protein [Venturia nashicola]TLD20793.1 WD40 repeat-like protein [Venturia nashicola]
MAEPFRNNGPPPPPPFAPSFLQNFKSNTYIKDEGYSEDTRSQAGSEMRADSRMGEVEGDIMDQDASPSGLPDWVVNMNETERSEFAYAILRSLPTSSIAKIVDRLNPLLHIDPVRYLPPELTFEIFSYLEPHSLLTASTLCKSWRSRTLDSRLWRQLFAGQGWAANSKAAAAFLGEQRIKVQRNAERKSRIRPSEDVDDAERKSPKKRLRDRQVFGESSAPSRYTPGTQSPLQWATQHGPVEADEDARMEDAPNRTADDVEVDSTTQSPPPLDLSSTQDAIDPPFKISLLLNSSTDPTLNWQYLFKQKRRLEANWIAGKYKNFMLPHPAHKEEAHKECVYTIQYSANFLVSGSRDRTLRVWDLSTQRLHMPPLTGHSASVLCLQFDDSPDQDIIVSGGSDCHVIIWRFSTGKVIQKLEHAHSESVLNLRFDDRYLITCSKDKTIKVWNRRALLPTDDAYPIRGISGSARFPSYILNLNNLHESQLNYVKPLREHSLLMTLEGHGAAVNAIQVLGSQIVSASGDRHVKIWDVKTGQCLKTISGHAKGIACVQFDGRRIVSGSSDETVRIFDRATGAEVACLKGHTNLVRTVQARFGDVAGSAAAEEQEARDIDRQYYSAKLDGSLESKSLTREERQARNAGGRDPKDIFAVGAKLPPGGGGSKWARIVSGSYDETVIIWKRDVDGKWIPAHNLLQWQAVSNAGGDSRRQQQPAHVPPPNATTAQQQLTAMMTGLPPNLTFPQWFAQFGATLSMQQLQQLHLHWTHQLNQINQANQATQAAATTHTTATTVISPQLGHAQAPSNNAAVSVPLIPSQWLNNLPHHPAAPVTVQATQQTALANIALTNAAIQANNQHPAQMPVQAAAGHGHHGHHAPAAVAAGNHANANNNGSRVFKLQFDSRRIICCSQDPTIVGWDFANGDKDIEDAARFFGEDI